MCCRILSERGGGSEVGAGVRAYKVFVGVTYSSWLLTDFASMSTLFGGKRARD